MGELRRLGAAILQIDMIFYFSNALDAFCAQRAGQRAGGNAERYPRTFRPQRDTTPTG